MSHRPATKPANFPEILSTDSYAQDEHGFVIFPSSWEWLENKYSCARHGRLGKIARLVRQNQQR